MLSGLFQLAAHNYFAFCLFMAWDAKIRFESAERRLCQPCSSRFRGSIVPDSLSRLQCKVALPQLRLLLERSFQFSLIIFRVSLCFTLNRKFRSKQYII